MSINTKRNIVAQSNNPTTPGVVSNTSSVTTNTGNTLTGITSNNAPKSPGAPGGLTGGNTNTNPMARSATPQNGVQSVATASPVNPTAVANSVDTTATANPNARGALVDQFKPTLDGMAQGDKDYLDKWQQAESDRLEQDYKNQMDSINAGKTDVENWYNSSKDELGDVLYKQHELTNIDGTNRGISTSPQILGLKGVHNINYNKNLTKLMEQKQSYLNQIQLQIQSLTNAYNQNKNDLSLSVLDKTNGINKEYNNTLLELMKEEEQRKYEEELYNKRYGSSSGSGSGYSSGYSSYGKSNYTPYSYSPSNSIDTKSDSVRMAGAQEMKQVSTDTFNDLMSQPINMNNYYDVASQYDNVMAEYLDAYAPYMIPEIEAELKSTMETAKYKLLDKARASSTNTPYVDSKGIATQHKGVPKKQEYIDKTNKKFGYEKATTTDKNIKKAQQLAGKDSTNRTVSKLMESADKAKERTTKNPKNDKTPKAYQPTQVSQNGTKNNPQTKVKQKATVPKPKAQASKAEFNKKATSNSAKNLKNTVKKVVEKAKSNLKKNTAKKTGKK